VNEYLWFSHGLIKSKQVKVNDFRSILILSCFMNLGNSFLLFCFFLQFMPLWFKEMNATKLWAHGENKWVKFFRLPRDRKEDGRKQLQKCNHYCNRPAVLWISHNYLTICVNAVMLSLVVSTCACTYWKDPQSYCNAKRLELSCTGCWPPGKWSEPSGLGRLSLSLLKSLPYACVRTTTLTLE
jgi:hypothetical protein